jgi:hypothetical protein
MQTVLSIVFPAMAAGVIGYNLSQLGNPKLKLHIHEQEAYDPDGWIEHHVQLINEGRGGFLRNLRVHYPGGNTYINQGGLKKLLEDHVGLGIGTIAVDGRDFRYVDGETTLFKMKCTKEVRDQVMAFWKECTLDVEVEITTLRWFGVHREFQSFKWNVQ